MVRCTSWVLAAAVLSGCALLRKSGDPPIPMTVYALERDHEERISGPKAIPPRELAVWRRPLEGKRYIVVLTTIVGATLGDPSAASKLMTGLRRGGATFPIIWLLEQKAGLIAVDHLLPPGVKALVIRDWRLVAKQPQLRALLNEASAAIAFPTFHHFPNTIRTYLGTGIAAPYMRVTEYNFMEPVARYGREDIVVRTGFGPEHLGIFVSGGGEQATALAPADDALAPYLERRGPPPVFGYFNKWKDKVSPRSGASLESFIALAILQAMIPSGGGPREPLTIVVPATPAAVEKAKDLVSAAVADDPILNTLWGETAVRLTTRESLADGPEAAETGKWIVEVINPFPLQKASMLHLFRISDPLVGVTGDQSLSEALSFGKIPFYQAMKWKAALWSAFTEASTAVVPADSLLGAFFRAQFSGPLPAGRLLDMARVLAREKAGWTTQMSALRQHIAERWNLQQGLLKTITTSMGKGEMSQ